MSENRDCSGKEKQKIETKNQKKLKESRRNEGIEKQTKESRRNERIEK